ncbi:MAG: condensation domain-containing protein [bacterium]
MVEHLAARGIEVRVEDGRLRVRAPRGRLDAGLKLQVEASREALVAWLAAGGGAAAGGPQGAADGEVAGGAAGGGAVVGGAADGAARGNGAAGGEAADGAVEAADGAGAPFPLTSVQAAYWLGRQGVDGDGPVSTYAYCELDVDGLDPARLVAAITRLVAHHPMLRVTVDDEGRQRIGAGAAVEVPVVDLAGHPPAEREAALAALRARLSHQILPAATGPLYDVRVARLGGGRWRLFLGLDLLVCDIASGLLLAGQALALYDDPGAALPAAGMTFREYVLTTAARRDGAAVEAARRWWRAQLESLPPAPSLPWVSPPPGAVTRFARRQMALAPDRWAAFRASARRRGLTPAAALATAYAEVLAGWSRRAPMTLNLTVFDRRPIHPDVDRLVGDFTETLLLAVDPGPALSFAARAGRCRRRCGARWSTARSAGSRCCACSTGRGRAR